MFELAVGALAERDAAVLGSGVRREGRHDGRSGERRGEADGQRD